MQFEIQHIHCMNLGKKPCMGNKLNSNWKVFQFGIKANQPSKQAGAQIREQMLVPDLCVITVESAAYKKTKKTKT